MCEKSAQSYYFSIDCARDLFTIYEFMMYDLFGFEFEILSAITY